MKKNYRIKKNEEFSQIISKKHSLASACFIVYYLDRKLLHARAGISVSKKLGDAVDRNKIKRQLRQMIVNLVDFDKCQKDFIVIVRKPYLNQEYKDNLSDLEKLLKKAIIV